MKTWLTSFIAKSSIKGSSGSFAALRMTNPFLDGWIFWRCTLNGEAGAVALFVGYAPGHAGGVVGYAELAVWTEQDDAAVAA